MLIHEVFFRLTQALDFANVFKSFIGANFMQQPYAFAHAGVAVGK